VNPEARWEGKIKEKSNREPMKEGCIQLLIQNPTKSRKDIDQKIVHQNLKLSFVNFQQDQLVIVFFVRMCLHK